MKLGKSISTAGIIVEFNPLHTGHIEHINETRRITRCEHIIAVMSGNFVQRGEPALLDKHCRTRMALLAGIDIVIELPLPYVLCGVDYFARGAVALLAATGITDALCFGSESGDISAIRECGRVLAQEPPIYKENLRASLDAGNSFAAARAAGLAACEILPTSDNFFAQPNNTLGMEYCKALELLDNPMTAHTTHRAAGGASATAIRREIRTAKQWSALAPLMPDYALEICKEVWQRDGIVSPDDYSEIFRYLLCRADTPELEEGLLNSLRKYAHSHPRLSDLLLAAKTKRYTFTRLSRAACRIITGVKPPAHMPPYIRVLGFRQDAAQLLGEITRRAALPVITHNAALEAILSQNSPASDMLRNELEAGEIYRLFSNATKNERACTPAR